jgi:hypothetical protein
MDQPLFIPNPTPPETMNLKFRVGNVTYERHFHILTDGDATLDTLMYHIETFKTTIHSAVAANHRASALFLVFLRTLIHPNFAHVYSAYAADVEEETEEAFDAIVLELIKEFFTPADRVQLAQELRTCRLPRDMCVASFARALERNNNRILSLPGTEPALTEGQLKTAFFNAMPVAWKANWNNHHPGTIDDTPISEIITYFAHQQLQSIDKAKRNAEKQRKESKDAKKNSHAGRKRRERDERTNKHIKGAERAERDNRNDQGSNGERRFHFGHHQDPNADCLIHKGKGHTWKQCFGNPANMKAPPADNNRKAESKKNFKKQKTSFSGKVAEEQPAETANVAAGASADDMNASQWGSSFLNVNDIINEREINIDDILDDEKFQIPPEDLGMYALTLTDISSNAVDFLTSGDFLSYSLSNQTTMDPNKRLKTNESKQSAPKDFATLCDSMYLSGTDDISLFPNDSMNYLSNIVRPISTMYCKNIQNLPNTQLLRVLFDSGSDKTFINRRCLPKGTTCTTVPGRKVQGLHGTEVHRHEVILSDIMLPEFSTSLKVQGSIRATVFNNDSSIYDIILGNDVLVPLGIDILCATMSVKWLDEMIPFRPADYFTTQPSASFISEAADDPFDDRLHFREQLAKEAGYKSRDILESKYDAVDPLNVAQQQKHLTPSQRQDLANLLSKYRKLFSGELGKYPKKKVHLELKPNAVPKARRPYGVSRYHLKTFKAEIDRLVQIGVLSPCGANEWLAPSFIIPKKDGRVRWISDFRELNKVIKRRVYPLPRITDILSQRPGYEFFSKIDVSMHYYTFELTEESKNLCVICTPFGNYRYNRLPMGISMAPDIAQEVMEDLFRNLDEVNCYIDDVGCFSNSWSDHLKSLDKILTILQDNNFTVNPLKCEWGVKETDWLGYWLTPTGLKPWRKKINAILAIKKPTKVKELRSFLGAINFYRDMWRRRSGIIAPLTAASGGDGKTKVKWTKEMNDAFDQIKAFLAKDAFLRYPDHNKSFHIYTDASDYQMGAAIMQEGVPVAYWSKKLNAAQRNYTVGEKELLSIVEVLKEFKTMLYGCPDLHVYTDHLNNVPTSDMTTQSKRVIRWNLFLEDFGVQLHYIKGEDNPLADALSRLDFDEEINPTVGAARPAQDSQSSMALDDVDLLDCFVNLPPAEETPFVLDYRTILEAQLRDARLKLLREKHPDRFVDKTLGHDLDLCCYIDKDKNKPWRVYLPDELLQPAVKWYHQTLGHLGQRRLEDTMSVHLYNTKLRDVIEQIVAPCPACQLNKSPTRGYGETAPREVSATPWREVHVDLIGPWTLNLHGYDEQFIALTMIDPVTHLTELVRLENKTSDHVALQFNNVWLSRYPKPVSVTYDNGKEFTGNAFQKLLADNKIKPRPTTVKNPQANSICERMHQVVGNSLRTMTRLANSAGITSGKVMVDTALSNCMYAIRAALHSGLKATPGSLVYGRDMVLDLPVIADWINIQQHRQQLTNQRTILLNRQRISHDYKIGDQVLKLADNPAKLAPRAYGPFTIVQVHTNGTISIRRNAFTVERISIRRVKPYRQ